MKYISRKNIILVENLNKSFDNHKVLKNVSFTLKRNESLVIIGGSGCGKSVLLKCLAGLEEVDMGGKIVIDSSDVTNVHTSKRRNFVKQFSMLFQNNALFDSLPVWHNICFNLIHHKQSTIDEMKNFALEKLESVGLSSEILNKIPADLSGGMQKRVAIARAIASEPTIIFYDEPTSGLDPILSDTIAKLIANLNNKHKNTSITITHDPRVMQRIADKVAVIKNGEIIWLDSLKNTLASKNPYVQSFLQTIK
jgi:phospholipid/cholesterol/gamma-HCH transport system ATP-binding protein